MAEQDYRTSKQKDMAMKRRPSIQMSPTLQKPVFIISKNLNGSHILQLIDELDKNRISYQMQQETETLGFTLNQSFFVIVDNRYGEVALGYEFGSPLMTIVGYPKTGRNKKNKCFQKPSELIAYFKEFTKNSQMKKQVISLFSSDCHDHVLESEEPNSKLRNKIEVRSICKYKLDFNQNLAIQKNGKKISNLPKLIILLDNTDKQYKKICQHLVIAVKKNCLQIARNIEQIRKKAVFHTSKEPIYYLVNQIRSKELIKVIFFGEIIIYDSNSVSITINNISRDSKIYGMVYEQRQLIKILEKIGVQMMLQTNIQSGQSQLDKRVAQSSGRQSNEQSSKQNPLLLKVQSKPKDKPIQESKIKQNMSALYPNNEFSGLNTSDLSHATTQSRKIKRLKRGNHQSKPKQIISPLQYEKENKGQLRKEDNISSRKRTLRKEECSTQKSKKNLTFSDDVNINQTQTHHKRKIRPFDKIQPEEIVIQTQNCTTMTENQYYATSSNQNNNKTHQIQKSSLINNEKDYSFMTNKFQKIGMINGVFYRQFVPKFKKIIQRIKVQPSTIFFQNYQNQVYHSFIYTHQYDHFVKSLKNKLEKTSLEEFNFVVFLEQEEASQFIQYCQQKAIIEEKGQLCMNNTKRSNQYSNFEKQHPKTNVHLFIMSIQEIEEKVIDFGKINIYQSRLLNDEEDVDLSQTLESIHNILSKRRNAANIVPHQ